MCVVLALLKFFQIISIVRVGMGKWVNIAFSFIFFSLCHSELGKSYTFPTFGQTTQTASGKSYNRVNDNIALGIRLRDT